MGEQVDAAVLCFLSESEQDELEVRKQAVLHTNEVSMIELPIIRKSEMIVLQYKGLLREQSEART